MARQSIALSGLLFICLVHALLTSTPATANLPDLAIKQYEFVSTNNKSLRVQVANNGKAASKPCRLELAVRKINGVAATRTAFETVPAIEPGKEVWVSLTASGILQAAISLKDTTFRLIVDETNIVAESNEDNNEMWHNSN
jgi:subtilase family serine protease